MFSLINTENGKTAKRCLFSMQRTEKLPNVVSFQYRQRENYQIEEGKFETTGGGIISGMQ
jgi:hypothetical protein